MPRDRARLDFVGYPPSVVGMSTEQSVDPELVEQTKQQIRNLVREIAQITKSDVAPSEFYNAVLNRIVSALAAVGGAVWTVSETGQLAPGISHQSARDAPGGQRRQPGPTRAACCAR